MEKSPLTYTSRSFSQRLNITVSLMIMMMSLKCCKYWQIGTDIERLTALEICSIGKLSFRSQVDPNEGYSLNLFVRIVSLLMDFRPSENDFYGYQFE